jgi:uncharacterized protein YjiS (DUF1127 family)
MSTLATLLERFVATAIEALRRSGGGRDSLDTLDDRTLADIGVSRSEIASIEAEAHGLSRPTRRRIVVEPRHA